MKTCQIIYKNKQNNKKAKLYIKDYNQFKVYKFMKVKQLSYKEKYMTN